MNWFTKLWNNPNIHIVLGTAAGIAATIFPAYSTALMATSAVLGTAAVALPDQKPVAPVVPPAPVVALPAAAAGGSYHAVDYAQLGAALLAQFATKPADVSTPSR